MNVRGPERKKKRGWGADEQRTRPGGKKEKGVNGI